jgi:hypothetical protein
VATPPPPPSDESVPPPPPAPPPDPGAGVCPRCGSPYQPGQEYCLECGLRLPHVRGFVAANFIPALSRTWRRHARWYPGDWIWPVVFGLVVAGAGATVAILIANDQHKKSKTIVATTSTGPGTTTSTVPPPTGTGTETSPTGTGTGTSPTTTETSPTTTEPPPPPPPPPPPTGPIKWPAGKTGFTVVLASVAHSDGLASARKTAQKGIDAGLTDVGVLNSDNFSSLRGGFYVVFSGVFDTLAEAQSGVATAQGTFPQAYQRKIVP